MTLIMTTTALLRRTGWTIASRVRGRGGARYSLSDAPSNAGSPRPFRILGLQQVALGSLEKEPMKRVWEDILGVPKVGDYKSEKENVDESILELADGVEIDLMTPLDPNKSPKVHIPPLNHIGIWVDDLPVAVQWMTEQGVRFAPGGMRKGAAGHDVAFIHPKGNDTAPIGGAGVLIELVQAPPDLIVKNTKE